MTARLTNAIGTRLGLTHSWKSKMIPNTKTQMLSLFKREQDYNLKTNSLFSKPFNVKQSILRGQYVHYYNEMKQTVLDMLLYDTAFERVRRNIKQYRKYTSISQKTGNQYYRQRNVYLLKRGIRFKPHSLITRLLKKFTFLRFQFNRKKRTLFKSVTSKLNKFKYPKISFKKVKQQAILTIHQNLIKRRRAIYFRKLLSYFFARNFWFTIHSYYATKRLCVRRQTTKNTFKVNLISIPKIYVTHKIIMAFIIKKLYLNYNLFEIIRQFKRFFKLRTSGYTIRGCGKLTKKQRAWYIKRHQNKTKINNLNEYVTYAYDSASLRYGNVGIKLWINY